MKILRSKKVKAKKVKAKKAVTKKLKKRTPKPSEGIQIRKKGI